MTATRDALLATRKRRYATVPLPVCGLIVRIQSLTELERSEYEAAYLDNEGRRIRGRIIDAKARLIMACAVDDDGHALFLPGDERDILAMDSADTGALWDACWNHVGFAKADAEALAKN